MLVGVFRKALPARLGSKIYRVRYYMYRTIAAIKIAPAPSVFYLYGINGVVGAVFIGRLKLRYTQ